VCVERENIIIIVGLSEGLGEAENEENDGK
jgi:hypothetical protein